MRRKYEGRVLDAGAVIESLGGVSKVAAMVGITHPSVAGWRRAGKLPPKHAETLARLHGMDRELLCDPWGWAGCEPLPRMDYRETMFYMLKAEFEPEAMAGSAGAPPVAVTAETPPVTAAKPVGRPAQGPKLIPTEPAPIRKPLPHEKGWPFMEPGHEGEAKYMPLEPRTWVPPPMRWEGNQPYVSEKRGFTFPLPQHNRGFLHISKWAEREFGGLYMGAQHTYIDGMWVSKGAVSSKPPEVWGWIHAAFLEQLEIYEAAGWVPKAVRMTEAEGDGGVDEE